MTLGSVCLRRIAPLLLAVLACCLYAPGSLLWSVNNTVDDLKQNSLRVKESGLPTLIHDNKGTETTLHCWRQGTLGERAPKYHLLITGCGYSATAFLAKTLSAAGYHVGHEEAGRYGVASWMGAAHTPITANPLAFKHIFLIVRHPLKVIRSWHGEHWPFEYRGVAIRNNNIVGSPQAFAALQDDFKVLEWWTTFTLLGENLAECYMRTEDISVDLLQSLCTRAELPGNCQDVNWKQHIDMYTGYNGHKNSTSINKTWPELEALAKTRNEKLLLDHARQLCRRYGYDNC